MRKVLRVSVLIFVVVFVFASIGLADNPIIEDIYTADPAALVYNGTVYLYIGHDEGTDGYVMNDWRCFSSTDMINWVDHGSPLAVSDFSWASGDAWASEVVYRDGMFYYYVCAEHATIDGKAIGVAVSSSPTGPFYDPLGEALITNDMTKFSTHAYDDIDPTVFIDDDGQAYMYWGNTSCMYVKLNDDMISLDGSIYDVTSQLSYFTEAPWLYKRNSTYYLVYAYGWPEQVAYATSSSPTGPWTYQGIISNTIGTDCGTQHPAIIDFYGSSYYFSHNDSLPGGHDYKRSVYVEEFEYNSDGSIPLIPMTSTGVDGIKSRIQSYNYQDRYVRHYDFDARIDTDSNINIYMDSQWQIVPGLAASNGYISIQSVNYPGYYLRHSDFDFVLEKNDGSDQFAADATFRQLSGLADSSWTSFQSYNYSSRYLRHYDYELKLEEIDSDLDREDATFKIIN